MIQNQRGLNVTAATFQEDPTAEVERLRALLEKQPSCLMRVGIDGTILAVSDAALGLLGASPLAEVLDASVLARIDGDAEETWCDFVRRVLQGGSASLECEMTDPAGSRRAVTIQGVALAGHPDGIESLLVTVRDVSTARRLEASLQEQEQLRHSAQEEVQRLRAALDAAVEERKQLAATIDQLKAALTTAIDATLLAEQIVDKGAGK